MKNKVVLILVLFLCSCASDSLNQWHYYFSSYDSVTQDNKVIYTLISDKDMRYEQLDLIVTGYEHITFNLVSDLSSVTIDPDDHINTNFSVTYCDFEIKKNDKLIFALTIDEFKDEDIQCEITHLEINHYVIVDWNQK